MADNSGESRIADCMRRLVRGQQPEESGGSVFNINVDILQELIDRALESDRNKQEIFDRDALKPITAALDARYGDDMNCLAADVIGLLAEGSNHQARCCASYRHEGISVMETLTQRSQSINMRVRTSARAALYSIIHTTQPQVS
ncbi:uncharacterized protein [Amphiura filiformis]|uniref:uncharacterized protein n=1 Tax=Amphiura filiformis TaxID=82378 RepID=UPI003B214A11